MELTWLKLTSHALEWWIDCLRDYNDVEMTWGNLKDLSNKSYTQKATLKINEKDGMT